MELAIGFVGADLCVGPWRVPCGGVSGRTHRSAPTRGGRYSEPTENWCEDRPCQRGGTEPAPYGGNRVGRSTAGCAWGVASASQIPKRNLGRQSWSPRPTEATLVMRSEGPMWASAPTGRRGGFRNHPGQRRIAERLRQRMGGRGGNRSRDHPQRGQQRRTIPQSRMRRDSSLCTREPWETEAMQAVRSSARRGGARRLLSP